MLVEPGQLGRSLSDGSKFSLREELRTIGKYKLIFHNQRAFSIVTESPFFILDSIDKSREIGYYTS